MAKFHLDTKTFSTAIAIAERCAGNGEVGEMWTEARSFPLSATLKDVIDWASVRCEGRLMLTLDQSSVQKEK